MANHYASSNYGAHSKLVDLGGLMLWYSYETVIAFRYKGVTKVRKNDWSTTTGRHLNAIDNGNKKARIDGVTFQEELRKVTTELGL